MAKSGDRSRVGEVEPLNIFNWISSPTVDKHFKDKKVVLFGLPGAFTPTCSSKHLPGYEEKYNDLIKLGIDDVICLSVNDEFVMESWGKDLGIKNVKLLADGNLSITDVIGMRVDKSNIGFGFRCWRFSAVVDNGVFTKIFKEEFLEIGDPFEVSDVDTMIKYLKETQPKKAVKKKTTRTRKKKTNVETPKD